jgi:hypothetical protein
MPGLKPNVFTAAGSGMTRLRVKGSASAETLYELTNGFVNADRMPQRRPGCIEYLHFGTTGSFPVSPASAGKTHGLVPYQGKLYTFTIDPTAMYSGSKIVVVRLFYPNQNPPAGVDISQIHFAKVYMGYLYVCCEFTDGVIADFWLQQPAAWTARNIYKANDLVQPSTPNGYYYKAVQTTIPYPAWTPNLMHTWHDKVQPTVYNGFFYDAYAMNSQSGPIPTPPNVASGATEPIWPLADGAGVLEASVGPPLTASPAPDPPPKTPPGREDGGKYTNPGGTGSKYNINTPYRTP